MNNFHQVGKAKKKCKGMPDSIKLKKHLKYVRNFRDLFIKSIWKIYFLHNFDQIFLLFLLLIKYATYYNFTDFGGCGVFRRFLLLTLLIILNLWPDFDF